MSKTILYSITFIALGLNSGSLGPTLQALAAQTHVEMKQISNLFLARSFGTMIGSWMIGRMYDRFAGHPLMAASLVASAAGMALMPTMTVLWTLIILSMFMGMAAASINVGGNAMIVLIHGDRVRPFISALHFAFGLGGLLAPLLVAQFIDRADGLKLTYWTLALLILPALVLTMLSRSPTLHAHHTKKLNQSLPVLAVFLFALFSFLQIGAESSIMGWYFSYAADQGMSNKTAAQMNSAFWGAFSLGRLATIWLTTRFNAVSIVISNLCIMMIIALGLLTLPASPFVLWTGAIALGLFIAPIFPNTFGFAQRVIGLSGRATGWLLTGSAAGSMFWPWLIGQFFKSHGPQVLMWTELMTLLGALATITILIFQYRERH
jgi:MFS transporter, FHS family, Na+ dependent glucose transporter 1